MNKGLQSELTMNMRIIIKISLMLHYKGGTWVQHSLRLNYKMFLKI